MKKIYIAINTEIDDYVVFYSRREAIKFIKSAGGFILTLIRSRK